MAVQISRPEYIGFDNGGEYKNVFEELVNNYGMEKKNSTPFMTGRNKTPNYKEWSDMS